MAPVGLPPGFRFHPTDEELVNYYLKRKIHGHKIELDIIPEIELYKSEPWELSDKSFLPSRDPEWYFFGLRDRKYPNGCRTNRATRSGYWKSTGKDRKVYSQNRPIGMKKTLVYYQGRAPQGIRTNWVMHEYRLDETECDNTMGIQDSYALCRVFKKNVVISEIKRQGSCSLTTAEAALEMPAASQANTDNVHIGSSSCANEDEKDDTAWMQYINDGGGEASCVALAD